MNKPQLSVMRIRKLIGADSNKSTCCKVSHYLIRTNSEENILFRDFEASAEHGF